MQRYSTSEGGAVGEGEKDRERNYHTDRETTMEKIKGGRRVRERQRKALSHHRQTDLDGEERARKTEKASIPSQTERQRGRTITVSSKALRR